MDHKVQQTLTKYLGDMYSLESHGLKAISSQVDELKGMNHPDALQLAEDFKRTLERHVNEIEARTKALGGSPTGPVKQAVSAVAGFAAGLYNDVRTEQASKSIRDDYAFLSLDAIAYLMLHTTAMSLGDQETASLAARGYQDCARMVMAIDRVMPGLVLRELRQDGFNAQDVAGACERLIHDSWQSGSSFRAA